MRALTYIGKGNTSDGIFERPAVDLEPLATDSANPPSIDIVYGQNHLCRLNIMIFSLRDGIPDSLAVDVIPAPGRDLGYVLGFIHGRRITLAHSGEVKTVSISLPYQEKDENGKVQG